MYDEKTIDTIHNLLLDFQREFENSVKDLYKPFKYAEDDVLPAWRAAFTREKKANDFRAVCVDYFFSFLDTALPSVREFCPPAKDFFDSHRDELREMLSAQLADIVRRRSSFEWKVVMAGLPALMIPFTIRIGFSGNYQRYIAFNDAIIRFTKELVGTFSENVTRLSLQ